jgi:hypothetical protein
VYWLTPNTSLEIIETHRANHAEGVLNIGVEAMRDKAKKTNTGENDNGI